MNRTTMTVLASGLAILSGCTQDGTSLNRLEVKLDAISRQLESLRQTGAASGEEAEGGAFADAADPDFARKLAEADANVRLEMIRQRLEKARSHVKLTAESLPNLTRDMMSLDTILGQATDVELEVLADVEQEHQRLLTMLEMDVPALVTGIGKAALAEQDYRAAQRVWNTGSAVLEYYPSTQDPVKEAAFQDLASAHERIGNRIELMQHQRYNQWACKQLKEATSGIETAENDIARERLCLNLVGPIDPTLLEPMSLDLYSGFLDTLQSEVSLQTYYDIAERMSVSQRTSLFDM